MRPEQWPQPDLRLPQKHAGVISISPRLYFFMHVQSFPPLTPFGSTEDEHVEINAGAKGDGSVFRIWSVTPNHTLFLRILTEPDGYASYLLSTAEQIFPEPLALLPLAPLRCQRRVWRLLRRWGVN